ncbi:MAG: tRNA (adenosine(37)-N6)-threonylcarbamoyltransferase complex ATPase subunit type 1 TsaE [bacterium]|nr:tRNA (adenosine(37)-N6)-threonylcarbamoyltransferase complex ATPase subunit type 1 TsaE [bacterium]
MKKAVTTNNPEETKCLGKKIGRFLKEGDVIALVGNLGAGKTVIANGLCTGLGVKEDYITSPTYTIINQYDGRIPVYHIDLYRLNDSKELYNIGWDEYIYGNGTCIIEWADKAAEMLPEEYLMVNIEVTGKDKRKITLQAKGVSYKNLLERVK